MGQGGCKDYNNPEWCMCGQCKAFDRKLTRGCRDTSQGCACRQCVVSSTKFDCGPPRGLELGPFLQPRSRPVATGAAIVPAATRGSTKGPRVAAIAVRSGNIIDQVVFCFADETVTFYGKTGGDAPQRWAVQGDDYITAVRFRKGSFLHNVQFVTARGAVSNRFGCHCGDSVPVLRAPDGCEVVGLSARGKLAVICRPVHGPLPPLRLCTNLMPRQYKYLDQSHGDCYGYGKRCGDGAIQSLQELEVPLVMYDRDLEWLAKNCQDAKVRETSQNLRKLGGSVVVFCCKLGTSTLLSSFSLVAGEVLAAVGEKALLLGLISSLKTGGIKGLYSWAATLCSSAKAGAIISGIAGVIIGHIAAPVYAALGMDQQAVGVAAAPVMALGAGAIAGAGAALAVGFAVPILIAGIFHVFGEKASEMQERWRKEAFELFQQVSAPLNKRLNALPEGGRPRCPQGHTLVDMGAPTAHYAASADGGVTNLDGECRAGFDCCTLKNSRWQFRFVRFLCPYCATEYCEPCILKHLSGAALPPQVRW